MLTVWSGPCCRSSCYKNLTRLQVLGIERQDFDYYCVYLPFAIDGHTNSYIRQRNPLITC